jgi:hypothetical protein
MNMTTRLWHKSLLAVLVILLSTLVSGLAEAGRGRGGHFGGGAHYGGGRRSGGYRPRGSSNRPHPTYSRGSRGHTGGYGAKAHADYGGKGHYGGYGAKAHAGDYGGKGHAGEFGEKKPRFGNKYTQQGFNHLKDKFTGEAFHGYDAFGHGGAKGAGAGGKRGLFSKLNQHKFKIAGGAGALGLAAWIHNDGASSVFKSIGDAGGKALGGAQHLAEQVGKGAKEGFASFTDYVKKYEPTDRQKETQHNQGDQKKEDKKDDKEN